jgi:protein-arginine kinase activator protein McsA
MEKEKKILDYLTGAYNEFIKLERQHPDELRDFVDGIHKCQYLIGMRFARKHGYFPIKKEKLICPNCKRKIPNWSHYRKFGCKWCTPKNNTEFCNGKYS